MTAGVQSSTAIKTKYRLFLNLYIMYWSISTTLCMQSALLEPHCQIYLPLYITSKKSSKFDEFCF